MFTSAPNRTNSCFLFDNIKSLESDALLIDSMSGFDDDSIGEDFLVFPELMANHLVVTSLTDQVLILHHHVVVI